MSSAHFSFGGMYLGFLGVFDLELRRNTIENDQRSKSSKGGQRLQSRDFLFKAST